MYMYLIMLITLLACLWIPMLFVHVSHWVCPPPSSDQAMPDSTFHVHYCGALKNSHHVLCVHTYPFTVVLSGFLSFFLCPFSPLHSDYMILILHLRPINFRCGVCKCARVFCALTLANHNPTDRLWQPVTHGLGGCT